MQVFKYVSIAIVAAALLPANCSAQQADGQPEMLPLDCVQVYEELRFTQDVDPSIDLDLYVPEKTAKTPPLLVWIYGGGHDDRESRLDSIMFLTDEGYAVASIDSRSNGLKETSKHVQACKGAIRWLQAHAESYGYDATRIGVAGSSAGAPLALTLGLTADVDELEGVVAGHLDQSSRVHAVVSFYKPGDVVESLEDRERSRNDNPSSDDGVVADSSLQFLTPDDAPLLIIQEGNQGGSARGRHTQLLYRRYLEGGLEATMCRLGVAGNDGHEFGDVARHAMLKAFFDKHVKQIVRDVFAEEPSPRTDALGELTNSRQPQPDRGSQRREEFGKRFAARGAQVGEEVPDVTVYTLAGEPLQLSSLWTDKPTVLVTGSITCPIAYRNCPSLTPLQDDYGDAVDVVILYQREAHAKPEGDAADRPRGRFRGGLAEQYLQPKTQDERFALAKIFDEHMSSTVRIVVADISDDVNEQLGTGPNMGLLISPDGKIVVKQGWYDSEAMRTEVAELMPGGPK
jgi:hypothetical protein